MNNKKWNNYEVTLPTSTLLTKTVLAEYIDNFFKETIFKINDDQHVYLILRVRFSDNSISTIGKLQKVNKEVRNDYIEHVINHIDLINEAYSSKEIKSIIFSYGVRQGKIIPTLLTTFEQSNYQTYYNNKLPIGFLPNEYGTITRQKDNFYIILVNKNTYIYLDQITIDGITTNKIEYVKNSKTLFTWTDKLIESNHIIREIGKSTYHYIDKELILIQVTKQTKPIRALQKHKCFRRE